MTFTQVKDTKTLSENTAAISESIQRIDALGKVTGETKYPGDIRYRRPVVDAHQVQRARPRACRYGLTSAKAEALPGVVRVFTSSDVPVNEYGLVIKDQPVLVRSRRRESRNRCRPLLHGHGGHRRRRNRRYRPASA